MPSIVSEALVTIHKNFSGNWFPIAGLWLLFILITMTIAISFGVRVFLDSKSTMEVVRKIIFSLFFAILTISTFILGLSRIFDLKNLHPSHHNLEPIRVLSEKQNSEEWKLIQEAKQFHEQLDFVADLHCDTLMWSYRGTLDNDHPFGINLKSLQRGNVALQVFSSVTQYPLTFTYFGIKKNTTDIMGLMLWSQLPLIQKFKPAGLKLLTSRKHRVKHYSNFLQTSISKINKKNGEIMKFIKTRSDFQKFAEGRSQYQKTNLSKKFNSELEHQQILSKLPTGALLSIESLHAIDSDSKSGISDLYDFGVRMIGLSHFTDDSFGSCATGVGNSIRRGFADKPYAETILQQIIDKNLIIDVAHASEFLIDDVLAFIDSKKPNYPIIISHTGVKGTCNNTRNLDDRFILEITKRGGVMGIAMFDKTTCTSDMSGTVEAMKYVKNLVLKNADKLGMVDGKVRTGVESIALGSDADGLVETTPSQGEFWKLTYEMLKAGFSKEEISLIMGGNVKNFLLKNLPEN